MGVPRRERHRAFAFELVKCVRREEPGLFDARMERDVVTMMEEAVECELRFAEDLQACRS